MIRFAAAAGAAATCLLLATSAQPVAAPDSRALPMQFDVWTEGPAQACGSDCRTWVSASGAITSDTPRDFEAFAKKTKIAGATIALDSDGGSVLGALALGRAIRKLGMTTTVGKTIDLSAADGTKRARLQPKAYCESMCAFVLLAGVERRVPAEARVMVHQIWLGDRRDDPTAANYSAEDLVVVQRDIGRLARYTVEMGGGVDLLEIALKIPPWEPMRMLSRDELRTMKVETAGDPPEVNSGTAASSAAALANGARAAVNVHGWAMVAVDGRPALGRNHPLTLEGDDVGAFELNFACGEPGRDYIVTYSERRRGDDSGRSPAALTEVEISLAGKPVQLKVVASRPRDKSAELNSIASGRMPVEMLKAFAEPGNRSMMVETASDDAVTAIRVGNAGIGRILPALTASCTGTPQPTIRNSARFGVRQGG
jgi:hypothetical protein